VTALEGILYDGRSAAPHPVTVRIDGARIAIAGPGMDATLDRSDIEVDSPVPGVARRLRLPGGAEIETADHASVDAAWPGRSNLTRVAYWLESRNLMAVLALVVTAALAWFFVTAVLPLAAEPVARSIRPEAEQVLGEQTLRSLDATLAEPSELPPARRETIEREFASLVDDEPAGNRIDLQFRRMQTPNAFALPGRTIVLTDEMVAFVQNDDELMGVLAHEIGHMAGRHALRMVLQQSGIAVLIAVLAGDAAGITLLAVAAPIALLNARYSRAFELAADDHAYALLQRHGRPLQPFADLLRRLAENRHTADPNDPLLRYLNSHPDLDLRIHRTEAAARGP